MDPITLMTAASAIAPMPGNSKGSQDPVDQLTQRATSGQVTVTTGSGDFNIKSGSSAPWIFLVCAVIVIIFLIFKFKK